MEQRTHEIRTEQKRYKNMANEIIKYEQQFEEIRGTNDITDKRALTPHEIARMEFARKHFTSLGIEAVYKAPIREFSTFKTQAEQTIKQQL